MYVHARVGSKVQHFVGLGLMIGGLVAAGYGTFFLAVSGSGESDGDHFARDMSLILFSAAGVLEGMGLPMFLKGTTVEVR